MKTPRTAPVGRAAAPQRKHRPRPVPKWLSRSSEIETIARSRCLLILSVLSGQVPVTDAIAQAKISRGTYYQLETRALQAILAAMSPLASSAADGSADLSATTARIAQLEQQVRRLEQEKRRTQRLWLLTRKTIRVPLVTPRRGRPRSPNAPRSASRSPSVTTAMTPSPPSSPTPPGAHSP